MPVTVVVCEGYVSGLFVACERHVNRLQPQA